MKLKSLTKGGWRTYAACAVLVAIGLAAAFGISVPDWVITIVGGLGGIAGRAAIANDAKKTAIDARQLVEDLRGEVVDTQASQVTIRAVVSDLQDQLRDQGRVL